MSYVYNGTDWTSGQPSLSSGTTTSTNFTAVAAAQTMRVYGLSNGTIYEYQVNETDPLSWSKTTTVASS